MLPRSTQKLAQQVVQLATKKGLTISTAESCTGGLIIGALTEISGSSTVVDRGFITYTNQAKVDMLDVASQTLQNHGAVSEHTASEMAKGAKKQSGSNITVAVTGIAGPSGGSAEKPVGLVHFGFSFDDKVKTLHHVFKGNRQQIRKQTVETALKQILSHLNS